MQMKVTKVSDNEGTRWYWTTERGEQAKSGYGATEGQALTRLIFALGSFDLLSELREEHEDTQDR